MKTRAALAAVVLLATFAARAQEVTPPLAVRKDALRPGWFFVGVVPGVGTDVPILIELRVGSENAPARKLGNGAVLVPTYNDPADDHALAVIGAAFPGREVIGIDCTPLILQHGSLHCVTMQLPKGVLA